MPVYQDNRRTLGGSPPVAVATKLSNSRWTKLKTFDSSPELDAWDDVGWLEAIVAGLVDDGLRVREDIADNTRTIVNIAEIMGQNNASTSWTVGKRNYYFLLSLSRHIGPRAVASRRVH